MREALQQLSALIREHLQRKPQQQVGHLTELLYLLRAACAWHAACLYSFRIKGIAMHFPSFTRCKEAGDVEKRLVHILQRAPVFNITAVATGAMQRWPPPPNQAGQRGPPLRKEALPPHMQQPDQALLLDVQFRLLVPASHIGGVIGRKGDVIQSIRDATGAHIRAHEGSSGAQSSCQPPVKPLRAKPGWVPLSGYENARSSLHQFLSHPMLGSARKNSGTSLLGAACLEGAAVPHCVC